MQPFINSSRTYPFGKLYPIISSVAQFFVTKIHALASSWHDAANNDDLDGMLSIASLINHFKQSELYYHVSQNDDQVFLSMRTNLFISHTMAKLTKNGNSHNRKVASILIEVHSVIISILGSFMFKNSQILSFYYGKFTTIEEVFNYMEYLSQSIDAVQKLLLMKGNQCENFQILRYTPQYKYAKQAFTQFTSMVASYQKNPKIKHGLSITDQISTQTQAMIQHICDCKILDVFHSTLIYIKLDFLKFFSLFYEEQIAEMTKLQKKKKISNEGLLFLSEKGSFQYMSLLYRQAAKSLSTQKLLFSYLQPLLSFIPDALMSCKSPSEKLLILEKYFLKTLGLLNKLTIEEKKWYEQQYNTIKINSQRDFIRAFTSSSILNDIEIALTGFEEEEILEHKGVTDYKEEYEQILEYVQNVVDVKNKLIHSIQSIYNRFTEEWKGAEIIMGQIDTLLTQNQPKTSSKSSNQTKNSRQGSLSNNGKPKKANKRNKKPNFMDQILESNQEDQQTVYERDHSKQRRYDQDSFSRQTNEDEEANFLEINIFPLQNLRDKNQTRQKSVGKKVSSATKGDSSRVQKVNRSENQSKQSQSSLQSIEIRGIPRVMYIKSFVTYYQHHSHPYQSIAIFRQSKSSYLHKNQDQLSQDHSGCHQVVYPKIINKKLYETQQYSPAESKRCQFSNKFLEKDLPKLNDKLKAKRLQFIALKDQLLRQKNICKSAKNSKTQGDNLEKFSKQFEQMKNSITKLTVAIRRQSIQNGKIIISLFPLSTTQVGKKMHQSLTQCLQMWMKLVDLKRKKKQEIILGQQPKVVRSIKQLQNPFNHKLFQLQNPYRVDVLGLKQQEVLDYLFSLIYDFMAILSEKKDGNELEAQLRQFHNNLFSNLDLSHKCILLYYIYELYMHKHLGFTCLVDNFVTTILTKSTITEILQFLMIELKLQQTQFSLIYRKLYTILSENCFNTINHIVDTLLYDITGLVKDMERKKDAHSSSEIRDRLNNRNPYEDIEKLKLNIHDQFQLLIDMLNVWTIITFGIIKPQNQLMNPDTIKTISGVLLFYCAYCSSLRFMIISPSSSYNYQEPFCSNCPNSLMHRFEIESPDDDFIQTRNRLKFRMIVTLIECFDKLQKAIRQNQWKVTELNYRKYEQKEQSNDREQQQSLHRTQTLSPQKKQSKSGLKKCRQQHLVSINGLQLLDNYQQLGSDSFASRITRLNSENKNQEGQVERENKIMMGAEVNAIMSNGKKKKNKYLSGSKEVYRTQRKDNHSLPTNPNRPNLNSQQKNKQKQKQQQNHEYCYNMQRLLNSYFKYVFFNCTN